MQCQLLLDVCLEITTFFLSVKVRKSCALIIFNYININLNVTCNFAILLYRCRSRILQKEVFGTPAEASGFSGRYD